MTDSIFVLATLGTIGRERASWNARAELRRRLRLLSDDELLRLQTIPVVRDHARAELACRG